MRPLEPPVAQKLVEPLANPLAILTKPKPMNEYPITELFMAVIHPKEMRTQSTRRQGKPSKVNSSKLEVTQMPVRSRKDERRNWWHFQGDQHSMWMRKSAQQCGEARPPKQAHGSLSDPERAEEPGPDPSPGPASPSLCASGGSPHFASLGAVCKTPITADPIHRKSEEVR